MKPNHAFEKTISKLWLQSILQNKVKENTKASVIRRAYLMANLNPV